MPRLISRLKDTPITFRIDQELLSALEAQAIKEERDRSQLVRIMIREGLARRRAQPELAGTFETPAYDRLAAKNLDRAR